MIENYKSYYSDDIATCQKKIKYRDVVIPSITIGGSGYTNILEYKPTDIINKIIFSLLWRYESIQVSECVGIMADAVYLLGTPNDVFSNVIIRYFYAD
jgi:hypothetical protein